MAQHVSFSRQSATAKDNDGDVINLSIRDVLDLAGEECRGKSPTLTVIDDGRIRLSGDGSRHYWQRCGDADGLTIYAWSDPAQRAMVTLSHRREAGAR